MPTSGSLTTMAALEHEIRDLASFLCASCGRITVNSDQNVPILEIDNGKTLNGLATIAKYLATNGKRSGLLGCSMEEQAAISQWVEYRVSYVDRCGSKEDMKIVLKELDSYLSDKVFFVGQQASLADLVLYFGLHCIMNDLTFHDKQTYMNVSRWFDNVQHIPGIRRDLSPICFMKTPIYSGAVH